MSSTHVEIQIFPNPETLSQKATAEFVQQVNEAIAARGVFTVALAGGSTPKSIYALLASDSWRQQIPWNNVHLFWGDERHVPPDHPDSNYRMVREQLLDRVPIPATNVHRIKSENPDAMKAADEYEQELKQFFELAEGELPRFDLVLLGMGADGHTASVFPATRAIYEHKHLVIALWVDKFKTYRITLTPPVLNYANCVIFFVTGSEKAATLQAVLEGDYLPERFPSQMIIPVHGKLVWMVDQAAANLLQTHQVISA